MTTKEYQNELTESLTEYFDNLEVKSEWAAFKRGRLQYSPRVDIAIGPFNVEGQNIARQYDRLVRARKVRSFISLFYEMHIQNIRKHFGQEPRIPSLVQVLRKNWNARCLLAIEIENENSRKHIMGSLLNAASLGRVGIGIAFNEASFNSFKMIWSYQGFLRHVGKNAYDTTNFLIVTKEQADEILESIT
ncbi:MAG TPA: hypothetical protein PLJ60_06070 [Chryseolinea sp.]|nr:hypothetical protein [Chryseolinea sp.]HPM29884.1 hypothetical protein [Chryseolinea sp.]